MWPALPGPPTEVRPSEITATTVRLTWTYNGLEEPQYYVIQYKPKYANQVSRSFVIVSKLFDIRLISNLNTPVLGWPSFVWFFFLVNFLKK